MAISRLAAITSTTVVIAGVGSSPTVRSAPSSAHDITRSRSSMSPTWRWIVGSSARGVPATSLHRGVACRLGDAEVHRRDHRHGDAGDHLQRWVDDAPRAAGRAPAPRARTRPRSSRPGCRCRACRACPSCRGSVTPSDLTGTAMFSTTGVPSSSSTNIVEKTSPTGTWLAEDLATGHAEPAFDGGRRATRLGEVGTAGRHEDDALVGDPPQGRLGTGQSRRQRHAVNSVTCWCIAEASAVEPQAWASSRWAIATSRIVPPRPPSSSGTAIAR